MLRVQSYFQLQKTSPEVSATVANLITKFAFVCAWLILFHAHLGMLCNNDKRWSDGLSKERALYTYY